MQRQTVKMVAWNPLTRKTETVFPESEVDFSEMTPMFWCQSAGTYVTIPGVSADEVYAEWLANH